MTPRSAITCVFFVDGALFATWASRIPALSDQVHASAGILGLCLLTPAVAAVLSMPLVGRLLPGRSSGVFCRVAVAGLMAAIMLPGLAHTVPALAVALLAVGAANSTLDLVMNAAGVSIERGMKRPILSSLHAAFSFGGFAGAGLGALAAADHVAPLGHFAFAALLFGTPGLIADRLWARWGTEGLLRRSGALAAFGFALGLGTGTVAGALVGFAALGVGLAGVIPTLFRAGADQPGIATGPALAAVSSLGYLGFLAGPPIIGGIAQVTSLRMACGVLVLAGVIVLLLAPYAGEGRHRSSASAHASAVT